MILNLPNELQIYILNNIIKIASVYGLNLIIAICRHWHHLIKYELKLKDRKHIIYNYKLCYINDTPKLAKWLSTTFEIKYVEIKNGGCAELQLNIIMTL